MKISDRLFGSPISGKVREELEKRQHTKSNDDGILESLGDTVSEYKLSDRTPFVRMWTSVKLYQPEIEEDVIQEFEVENIQGIDAATSARQAQLNTKGSKIKIQYKKGTNDVEKYILYDPTIRERRDFATQTYIVGDYNYLSSYGESLPNQSRLQQNEERTEEQRNAFAPYAEELLPRESQTNPLMKPQAGITSVTSTTKELLGATKETVVNFTVHNFYDFDRIYNRYFLKPGAQIFVDFGFSDIEYLYEPELTYKNFYIKQIKDQVLKIMVMKKIYQTIKKVQQVKLQKMKVH